jgi:uncharacterized membrane protein YidH (DUF202 family)
MTTDPVIGSFVWIMTSLAFLAGSTAIVRLLDARGIRTPERQPEDAATPRS